MDGKKLIMRDENNNITMEEETNSEIDVPKCNHSKFCFSRDMSEKEEVLLRGGHENTAHSCLTNTERKPCKKFVTFDLSGPKMIAPKECETDESDSDPNLKPSKAFGCYFDTSDSESLSPSESEVFNMKLTDTVSNQSEIISKAEDKLSDVLCQLQKLWLNLQDGDNEITPSTIIGSNLGNKNLLQTVSLIALITDQLSIQYRNFTNSSMDSDRVHNLQSANELLEEELKNAKNKIHCMEAEMKYFSKENALLNTEVKEMAYKMASSGFQTNRGNIVEKSPEAEIFYKNPHQQQFDSFDSKVDDGINHRFIPNSFQKSIIPTKNNSGNAESHTEMLVLKRENEMDSLIRDVKFRNNNCSLHAQFQIYDEHLENWKRMLHATNDEKQRMLQDLVKVINEHKAVLKERDHYEFILKLLIQEKGNFDYDIQSLLQNLIVKLSEPSSDDNGGSSWIQTSLLEGAVQALQQQNTTQREEIYKLKHLLSESQMHTQVQANELDDCNKKIAQFLDELNSNDAKLKIMQEEAKIKCDKIQDYCNEAVAAKTGLDKKLSEREGEMKDLQELLHGMRKANKRHHKKFQDLQKANLVLIKEIQESKGNMDHLAEIISQLRIGLKDQKSQWNERLRLSSEEASQNKQHCDWLKCQMEQLSQQLKDALDRLKLHELDKVQLAQQLLLAEEERRVVDRKLQELRTALQGDTGLREALIERNEALQMEINRLRLAKTTSHKIGGSSEVSSPPPMEMRTNDDLMLSVALFPPTENHHNHTDKFSIKKNCYTTNYRRPNDVPRTAVSLHGGPK